jgi:galacturonosyltransferase
MRILILANNDVGLFQFRVDLIKSLLEKNKVTIALPYGARVDDLVGLGCDFIDTPLERRGMNPIKDYSLFRQYKKIIADVKPDLVITYTIKPNIYGGIAAKKKKVPYAVNITGLGTAFQIDNIIKKIVVKLYKIALSKAKIIFFENSGNREVFLVNNIIGIDRTKVLNGAGVDIEKYHPLPYPKERDKVTFLFVGRVMKEKGIDELLSATEKLVKSGQQCHLDIVGWCEEEYEDRLSKFESEGWLTYRGFQTDVRPFIEICHCFVLPSWHEGMANTNLESAASCRPVITTNIHGCLEAVEDNVSGYLVEKKNADSLYEAMKRFLDLSDDVKEQMGLAGRRRMEEIFDKKKVVEETLKGLGI